MKRLNTALSVLMLAAFASAVLEQLRRPPAERTWRGKAFEVIPYDFNVPTVERLKDAYWNPASSQIITERPLGIGWAVNFAALYNWLQQQLTAAR
jgi:hypothetical protein